MKLIQINSEEELMQQFRIILHEALSEIKQKERFVRFSNFLEEKDISRATLYSYQKRHPGLLTKIGNRTYVDSQVWNDVLERKKPP